MKSLFISLSFIIYIHTCYAQSFYKIYDFIPKIDHAAYQIAKLDSVTYVCSYFSTCGDPITRCCGLFKMDEKGNIIEKNKISNFSNSTRALLVDTINDRILYCGEEDDTVVVERDELIINEVELTNFSRITRHVYKDTKEKYFSVSQKEALYYNGKYVVALTGAVDYEETDTSTAVVYILNQDLAIDTALYFRFGNSINNQIWEMYEDAQGYLTLHFFHNAFNDYIRILKLDKSYKVVFDWETQIRANENRPRGCALRDGRILVVLSNWPNPLVPEIRAINADTTASWTYVWPYSPANRRRVTSLSQAKNGDIIGVGGFRDSLNRKWMPFIFSMTSDGELLWEKAFYNISNKIVNSFGDFGDIIETDNGDLIAVGFINQRVSFGVNSYDDQDIFIVRVDNEGCLYPTCDKITGVENIVVGSIDIGSVAEEQEVSIYPNPTDGSTLKVELKGEYNGDVCTASICDVYGKSLATAELHMGHNTIDLETVPSGMYIIKVTHGDIVINMQKIIVTR